MSRFEEFRLVEKGLERRNDLELNAKKISNPDFSKLKRMPIPSKYRTLSEKEKIEKALEDRLNNLNK